MEEVILVDEHDNELGTMEKLEAHHKGLLHRAFSVIIYNTKGEMLLQRRAGHKYHSPGLWTNACCSHPRPGEALLEAAARRLGEEMGIKCNLKVINSFVYRAELSDQITEHEFDYILEGRSDELPVINKDEADGYKYLSIDDIKKDISLNPAAYTFWFKEMIRNKLI